MQRIVRRSYLVSLTNHDTKTRILMRNALGKLGGREILPGLFLVALTTEERSNLAKKFGTLRFRQD